MNRWYVQCAHLRRASAKWPAFCGASAPEIAGRLGVTLKTANNYIASLQRHEKVRAAAARGERLELTPCEAQVAGLLETGATNRGIADRLKIGVRTGASHVVRMPRTVDSHAVAIREKLGLPGQTSLARFRMDARAD